MKPQEPAEKHRGGGAEEAEEQQRRGYKAKQRQSDQISGLDRLGRTKKQEPPPPGLEHPGTNGGGRPGLDHPWQNKQQEPR